jgi:hypothetical protein
MPYPAVPLQGTLKTMHLPELMLAGWFKLLIFSTLTALEGF